MGCWTNKNQTEWGNQGDVHFHQALNNPITSIYNLISTAETRTRQCTSIVNDEAYVRILGWEQIATENS